MATRALSNVLGVSQSLGGKSWLWRGGTMDCGDQTYGLGSDIMEQLLISRGVEHLYDLHHQATKRGLLC